MTEISPAGIMVSADQAKGWYIFRNGNQAGPVSREQLDELHRRGFFRAGDLLWSSHLGEWEPALDILEKHSELYSAPPPDLKPLLQKRSAWPSLAGLLAVAAIGAGTVLYYSGKSPAKLMSSLVSSVPTEDMARAAYDRRAAQRGFEVVSFEKVNGTNTNFLGMAVYEVAFKAVVSWPNGLNMQCKRPPPGMGVQCMGTTVLDPGARQNAQGSINFIKTENGWQADE